MGTHDFAQHEQQLGHVPWMTHLPLKEIGVFLTGITGREIESQPFSEVFNPGGVGVEIGIVTNRACHSGIRLARSFGVIKRLYRVNAYRNCRVK